MKRRILSALLLVALLAMHMPAAEAAETPAVSARRAILMDGQTGRVLYEKDADTQSLIASTTKIMTALLVCERAELDREIPVPAQAVGIDGSSMYLKAGERVVVRDLLYGMMLRSGNDAATALALHLAGSIPAFAAQMNERAAALGLKQTHFANPHGLDSEENYSTARDLAQLTRAALENETFRQVVATRTTTAAGRSLTNHNKLLWRYDGAIGVKTGYTKAAGRILVSAAQRGGRTLIAVTISDPDDWRDHRQLLDYGFSQISRRQFAADGQLAGHVTVVGGSEAEVALVTQGELDYALFSGERAALRLNVPALVWAPVEQTQAGTLEVVLDGKTVASVPVCFAAPVAAQKS